MAGEYPLPAADLATLLAATVFRPLGADGLADAVAQCWRDLAAIDRDLADRTLVSSLHAGASWETFEAVTHVLSTNPNNQEDN